MVKIKDFTLASKNLEGGVPSSSFTNPTHVHNSLIKLIIARLMLTHSDVAADSINDFKLLQKII